MIVRHPELNVIWLLHDLFHFDGEIADNGVALLRPIVSDYMQTILDSVTYDLFAYVYSGNKHTLADAAATLGLPIDEAERKVVQGVALLRFGVSRHESLLAFVVAECPEFATDHLIIVRQEYENMLQLMGERLGVGAIARHNSLETMLIADKTKGILRTKGLNRVLVRCLSMTELTEGLGLKTDVAHRVLTASLRK